MPKRLSVITSPFEELHQSSLDPPFATTSHATRTSHISPHSVRSPSPSPSSMTSSRTAVATSDDGSPYAPASERSFSSATLVSTPIKNKSPKSEPEVKRAPDPFSPATPSPLSPSLFSKSPASPSEPFSPPASYRPPQPHSHPPHDRPLPPSEVFSRTSPPLLLPHLDAHLDNLPPAPFTHPSNDTVFPPFSTLAEGIAAPGGAIKDQLWNLVGKRKVQFAALKSGSVFDTVAGWGIGVEGSNLLSSMYSLEGAYGAVQVVALVLTSIGEYRAGLHMCGLG